MIENSGLDQIETEIENASNGIANCRPIVIVKYKYPPIFLLTFILGLFISSYVSVSGWSHRENQQQNLTTQNK
jgi:hypothetical protein